MKAVPLPSPEVMLSSGCKRYYGHLRLPLGPDENFVSLYLPVAISRHPKGSPVLPRMASPACHPCYPGSLAVGSGSYCQDSHRSLPRTSRGSAASTYLLTRLRLGSLSLQPAGLLGSPNEPLSGNLVLRVTPCTSLMLHG
jgi:hypothetical protein